MGGYIGAKSGVGLVNTTLGSVQDLTATDASPEVTLINSTHEDTDGGREGKVIFKGQQSGGEESTLAEIQASHDGTADDEKGDLIFRTNDGSDGASPTEAMRIDSAQNVGIGTSSPTLSNGKGLVIADATAARLKLCDTTTGEGASDGVQLGHSGGIGFLFNHENEAFQFGTNNAERMRLDASGNLLVGKTATGIATVGAELKPTGELLATVSGDACAFLNRTSSNGDLVQFRLSGTTIGSIECASTGTGIFTASGANPFGVGVISGSQSRFSPLSAGYNAFDNQADLGQSNSRWQDVFATNGTIQTSDENEKQNISSLTSAEMTAATAISKLYKTYKWKDAVTKKGNDARTHTGVVAQQVQTAMSDAGLDASKYAFWCSDTWWEVDEKYTDDEGEEKTRTNIFDTKDEAPSDATEHTRMGVRYPELLAFVGAATEQRLTSIESRLTALEAE